MKFIPKQKPLQTMGEREQDRVKFIPTAVRQEQEKYCRHCDGPLIPGTGYCPVCGTPSAQAGRSSGMRYPAIRLNENGKALVCPHCENEELTPGDYCIICGNDIVNRCSDTPDRKKPSLTVKGCGSILPGNARYCSKCGNESAFFQKGWLRDWKCENTRKAIHNVSAAIDLDEAREENA